MARINDKGKICCSAIESLALWHDITDTIYLYKRKGHSRCPLKKDDRLIVNTNFFYHPPIAYKPVLVADVYDLVTVTPRAKGWTIRLKSVHKGMEGGLP